MSFIYTIFANGKTKYTLPRLKTNGKLKNILLRRSKQSFA